MYVIYDKNDNNRIILGPMEWRPKYFSTVLSEEYEQDIEVLFSDQSRVPYEIISGLEVRSCDTQYPNLDVDTEDLVGPTWTFHANGSATASWTKTNKPLHIVKNIFSNITAAERYRRETESFKHTINGKEYTINTGREDVSMFLLGMRLNFMPKTTPTATIKWKFPEGFADLTRLQVEEILLAYITYKQNQFDWENGVVEQIKNSSDISTVKTLDILPPEVPDPYNGP